MQGDRMQRLVRYWGLFGLLLLLFTASFSATMAPHEVHAAASGNSTDDTRQTLSTYAAQGVSGRTQTDRIILKFRNATSHSERSSIRRQERLERVRGLDLIGAEVARPSGRSVAEAVLSLERRPGVEYAEPDYVRRAGGYSDEPYFGQLWGLHNTGQTVGGYAGTSDVDTNALQSSVVTLGSPSTVVAVIDDGVDFSHPDLSAQRWVNPGESGTDSNGENKATNGRDDDGNGYIDDVHGWDFYNGDKTVHDVGEHAHGTHVAGTIAASLNGKGVVGVAPSVKVMALKFIGPDGGSDSDAILALEYAKKKGVRISNNSWGGPYYSQALKDAIEASGQLFVAAAGNGGSDGVGDNNDLTPDYPASYSSANILSVAAVHNEGGLSSFSNYGATSVDISAPGEDILSTVPTDFDNSGYAYMSGTSMATPHATGAAAAMRSVNPSLAPLDLKKILMDTGKPLPATAGYTVTGDMVDAAAAVRKADTVKPVVRTLTQNFVVGAQVNTTSSPATVSVRLSWSATDTGSSISRYELQQSNDGGSTYTAVSLPTTTSTTRVLPLKADSSTAYRFRVRARDRVGNWSGWKYTAAFKVYPYQESSGSITYPSGSWSKGTSSAWYGGYVRYSTGSAARSVFTFTGQNVAWVAPNDVNRGKAEVWLDGVKVATVDLYSSTALPRRIVFTRAVSPSVTHILEVRVLGTSGRPRVDVDAFSVLR